MNHSAQRGDDRLGEQSVTVEFGLGQHEQGNAAEIVSLEHAGEVRGDLVGRARRHPVEHHRERGPAVAGGLQQVPGNGVGVPGGGRDEEPEVGGGQQLQRELPVALDDGIDVGCVEEGQPGGQGGGGDDPQPFVGVVHSGARFGAGARFDGGSSHVGEYVRLAEPLGVVGMAHQHRGSRRRSQYPGRAHGRADETVHQGRLAGTGRAADDDEQGSVEPAEPGEEVVVELADDRGGGARRLLRVGQRQRKPYRDELIAQSSERSPSSPTTPPVRGCSRCVLTSPACLVRGQRAARPCYLGLAVRPVTRSM